MKHLGLFLVFLLLLMVQQVQAQSDIDTLRLRSKEVPTPPVELRMQNDKPWLEFDDSMPSVFGRGEKAPTTNSTRYTLHPYNTTTPYDWDPIYQRKIAIHADTWRGQYWRMLGTSDVKGMTISGRIKLEEKEPLLRFENGKLVGDYATLLTQYFTREFWRFRHHKNQKETQQVLDEYNKVQGLSEK